MSAIALFEGNGEIVLSQKTGKVGSFAMFMGWASKDARIHEALKLYATWLENGQYRPFVKDVLNSGLVPKAAVPYVMGFVPESGPIKREAFVNLCRNIDHAVRNKRNKDGNPVELKGIKAELYSLIKVIARQADNSETVIEQ